jgi:hypothetical protein
MLVSSVWRERSIWYFCVGLIVGAVLVSLLLNIIGQAALQWWMPPPVTIAVMVVLSGVIALHEIGLLKLRLPQNARQVPERVVQAGPRFGALQFGVEMGTGIRTYMTSAQPYMVAAVVLLIASPLEAVAAGLGFGLGRGLVPVSREVTDEHQEWSERFHRQYRCLRLISLLSASLSLLAECLPHW